MPIYQYKCRECGEVSDFFLHGFISTETLACPNCGSHNLDKLISVSNLLKGKATSPGTTCCGRNERCETPPCSTGERCRRT